jgi:ssDNA-binding replication factor A large subunit
MDGIIELIISKTGLKQEELMRKIKEKQAELSNLVSEEGAAYIVAKELGLDLIKLTPKKRIELKSIAPSAKNITVKARICKVFEAKEYMGKEKKFKVGNLVIADASKSMRVSLWDEQISLMKGLKVGDAIEMTGCYAKENKMGELEIRLGRRGNITVTDGADLPPLSELETNGTEAGIADFTPGGMFELRAAIVQLFETEHFYEVCPSCGSRIRADNGAYTCVKHGKVQPAFSIVVSGVIDDGTGNIRAVFFRESAEKLLGMGMSQIVEKKGNVFNKVDVVGKEFMFRGRARKNQMFDRLEFVVSEIKDVDAKTEANKLINALGCNKISTV